MRSDLVKKSTVVRIMFLFVGTVVSLNVSVRENSGNTSVITSYCDVIKDCACPL